jgi:hypothetical protein
MNEMLQLDLRSGILAEFIVFVDRNFVNRSAGKASTSFRGSPEFLQRTRPGRDDFGASASEKKRTLLLGVMLEHRHHESEALERRERKHRREFRGLDWSRVLVSDDGVFAAISRLGRD